MIIKKIKLHNIRSYLDQIITLPKGKVLLSGDIGSGKSTVLLAIEFALFGIQRGMIDGASLLRNGKDVGYVEVELNIEKHNIVIRRNLKRMKNTVIQSNALLVLDGERKKLTATELKSFILEILNYPPSLLKKKDLIYRYTVYTPQEDMKRIMWEDKENRLDTLRKVFDIDKYKRIIGNTEVFVSKLKENKKRKEGQISDLFLKKEQLNEKNIMENNIKQKISKIEAPLLKLQQEILEVKNKINEEQKKLNILTKEKIKITHLDTEFREKNTKLEEIKREEKELTEIIKQLEVELKDFIKEDLEKIKKENENLLENGKANEKTLERKLTMLTAKKEKLFYDSKKISQLKFCPVCKQKVSSEHRKHIVTEISSELEKIKKEFQKKEPVLKELRKDLEKIEFKLREIMEKEKKSLALKIKLQNLNEKETRKSKLFDLKMELKNKISELSQIKESSLSIIEKYKDMEENHKKTLELLEDKQKKEKILAMRKAGFDQAFRDCKEEMLRLKDEILKKENIAQKLDDLKKLQDFLTKNFSMVIEMIEKQVMLKLNAEFNLLFKKWFMMLVDDFHLELRIDPEFTPIIEQGGYEINYNYLSGGEKTALALAYRLALNQVINSMLSKIKTRNLLILDEPTDGFSAEQLDKMRDVLHELKTEQLILVSHESKIESFVEHVLRFTKQGHVSHVIN